MSYQEEVTKSFEEKKYVLLKDFLDKESCKSLSNEMQRMVDVGLTTKDSQCPLSDAVHGAPVFDALLEQLAPVFSSVAGKRLYPTYAYARLYRPGEVLRVHRDRPSCEISATLTLGFEGDSWPIYMADDAKDDPEGILADCEYEDAVEGSKVKNVSEIMLDVGDAVLYKGMEVWHWRKKYEGKWLAQVFLHYVDADGPNSEWKYDKREKLANHIAPDYTIKVIENALTPEACSKLIESLENTCEYEDGRVGGNDEGELDRKVRNVKRVILPTYRGISATMCGMGINANRELWNFDITHSNQTEYLKYGVGGHYVKHTDLIIDPHSPETRKLTVLLFLNSNFEGGQFFIENGHEKFYPPQNPGTLIVFPSFMLHGVEPVTKGIRRSIVTWMVGPWLK
jgi:predicted 2-oxoglutarate/Fe(II)-dependent dioxygenase YbiX